MATSKRFVESKLAVLNGQEIVGLQKQFDDLLNSTSKALRAHAYSLCRDHDKADDLFTEACGNVWKRFDTINPKIATIFYAYFKRTITNLYYRSQLKKETHNVSLDELEEEYGYIPKAQGSGSDENLMCEVLLNGLSLFERNVIMLNAEGIPARECALRLGISKNKYDRTLSFVRELLQKKHFGAQTEASIQPEEGIKYLTSRQIAKRLSLSWFSVMPLLARFKALMVVKNLPGNRQEYLFPSRVVGFITDEIGNCPPSGDWLTAYEMGDKIGKGWNWVMSRILCLSCLPELRRYDKSSPHKIFYHYPPSALDELRAMQDEIESYPQGGDYLTLDELRVLTKRSAIWIINRAKDLGITTDPRICGAGRITDHYPPDTATKLLEERSKQKPAGDWLTINQLADCTKRGAKWVKGTLDDLKIEGELRRIAGSGKTFLHYPPSALEPLMQEASKYKPAGEWLTLGKLHRKLKKTEDWVALRIKDMPFELRLSRNGIVYKHYPPSVLKKLQAEAHINRNGQTYPKQ